MALVENDSFKTWYDRERPRLTNYARRAEFIFIALTVYMLVVQPFLLYSVVSSPYFRVYIPYPYYLDLTGVFAGLALVQMIISPVLAVAAMLQFSRRNKWVRHLEVISPDSLLQTRLGQNIIEIATKMNIDRKKINFRRLPVALRSAPLLSVTVARGEVYLVIPTAAFLLAHANPNAARGIVAHELAHVLHGDAALWKISEAYARYLQLYMLIVLGLALLQLVGINILLNGWPWNWTMGDTKAPGLVLILLLFTQRVLERRRLTELLADACAANQVGLRAVTDALGLLVSDAHAGYVTTDESSGKMTDHSGGMHPHPSFRVWHLRQLFSAGIE